MSEMMEYEPFSCFMVAVTASKTSSCSFDVGRSCVVHTRASALSARVQKHRSLARLVGAMDLIRKDVQQHLRV